MKTRIAVFTLALALAASALTFPAAADHPEEAWVIETVDSDDVQPWGTSLALDASGNLHISYRAAGVLSYAVRDGGWRIVRKAALEGSYSSLALRGSHPYIMYFDYLSHSSELEYAYEDDAGDWHAGVLLAGGNNLSPRESVSLVLDDAGYPHCVFSLFRCRMWGPTGDCWTWEPGDLEYTYWDGSTWKPPVAVGYSGITGSLVLDGERNVFLSWYNDYGDNLMHTYLHHGPYTPAMYGVDNSSPDVGGYSDIAVDERSDPHTPHISYYDATNGDLKYAYRTGALSWHIDLVDDAGDVGRYTSLALDGEGHPHISYYDAGNQDLKYAYRDASGWHTQIVDSTGDVGLYTSLALDAHGRPHISYIDASNGRLKYAYPGDAPLTRVYLPLVLRD